MKWSGVEWRWMNFPIPFHHQYILGRNKISFSFHPNQRERNMVVSDGMEWNPYHSFCSTPSNLTYPNNRITLHSISYHSISPNFINPSIPLGLIHVRLCCNSSWMYENLKTKTYLNASFVNPFSLQLVTSLILKCNWYIQRLKWLFTLIMFFHIQQQRKSWINHSLKLKITS